MRSKQGQRLVVSFKLQKRSASSGESPVREMRDPISEVDVGNGAATGHGHVQFHGMVAVAEEASGQARVIG